MQQLIKSPDAARKLGIKPGTLRAWRVIGKGPRYIKIGCTVFYREADLINWLNEREYANTSQHEKVVS